MQAAHILYSGMVQGVGFRYTVQKYAQDLNLNGWVKNLPDGCVEMMVEGSQDGIDQLCRHIENRFDGYIRDKKIQYEPAQGQYQNFVIAF